MKFKSSLAIVLAVVAWSAQAACPVTLGRFVANGAEVADTQTRLIWARCSLGQTWNGAGCVGTPTVVYHEQAMALAQAASGWRLPNVKELASIVDRRCASPAIDSVAFPDTPFSKIYYYSGFWSSTIDLSHIDKAYFVSFNDGNVIATMRNGEYSPPLHGGSGSYYPPSIYVRLVRATQ